MSENRFKKGDWTNCRYDICEIVTDDDEIICVVALNDADKIIGLLEENEQLQKENSILNGNEDDLRTTITKQVEAITEMKDIIYMLQDLRIGDYSSTIEEDMQELKKAYDGTLEDFLNYFKED